jgi:hypothetical protein
MYLFPCLFSHHHGLFHDQGDRNLSYHEQDGDYAVILEITLVKMVN